jgi:cyclophilin family peptidyl-prolyl cis-trans isomerase
MKSRFTISALIGVIFLSACSDTEQNEHIPSTMDTQATLNLSRGNYSCYQVDTSMGEFTLALDNQFAPKTAAHFDQHVNDQFYDDVIVFSAIKNFGFQIGNVVSDLSSKESTEQVESEQENGLKNYRGRIAMLRNYGAYDSASANFVISTERNYHLDFPNISDGGGLTVFGGVVQGMDVVDSIANVETTDQDGFSTLPVEEVTVNGISSSSCPATSETIVEIPHPVVESDNSAEIDLSRGDYSCYSMVTSMGNIEVAVDYKYAPITAQNFENYVTNEFYNGLLFHRVIDGFVAQTGGVQDDYELRETGDSIRAESRNGLKNYRGRLAMARTTAAHSATSQFYINLKDNFSLDFNDADGSWGYTVFGGVISGMDIVDQIASVETGTVEGWSDTPIEQVTLDSLSSISCPE